MSRVTSHQKMFGKFVFLFFLIFFATATNICDQELESGHCKALFYRFGFDKKQGKCVQFIYGGCQGNSNRFDTLKECEERCPATSA